MDGNDTQQWLFAFTGSIVAQNDRIIAISQETLQVNRLILDAHLKRMELDKQLLEAVNKLIEGGT